MNNYRQTALSLALGAFLLLAAPWVPAQWSAEPGTTVRNAFGPSTAVGPSRCRGACGSGCPDSCAQEVRYECRERGGFRRVTHWTCGTHPACREHDDCLDNCQRDSPGGGECQSSCDSRVTRDYGVESAFSWLRGGGPYDGEISFEYSRDGPDSAEAAFRCPAGARRDCATASGCVAADGSPVEPVFDSYPELGSGSMRVSSFVAGLDCGGRVCEPSTAILVTGSDACANGPCTLFGMEFDYVQADPSAPLECRTSTSGHEPDFVGDLLKQGADAMTARGAGTETSDEGENGMAQLLGAFGKVLASADSPEDLQVSIAPLGPDGKPIESQRVGSTPQGAPAPIPTRVELPAARGHLFVPMYQLASALPAGEVRHRRLLCSHRGSPVLETVFHLRAE